MEILPIHYYIGKNWRMTDIVEVRIDACLIQSKTEMNGNPPIHYENGKNWLSTHIAEVRIDGVKGSRNV